MPGCGIMNMLSLTRTWIAPSNRSAFSLGFPSHWITSTFTHHRSTPDGHTMARWAMRDIAPPPGLSMRVMARLWPGARRLLRKIRMPMRFAGGHCTIFGLILVQHRFPALRPSAFLRQARQLLLPSRLPSCQTRHRHLHLQLHQPRRLQLPQV